MNKIDKIKELKTNVKESEEVYKQELTELSFQTLDLIALLTDKLEIKLIDRERNDRIFYIKPKDVEPFYKFLKDIFEEEKDKTEKSNKDFYVTDTPLIKTKNEENKASK